MNLKAYREKAGMSQKQLSIYLDVSQPIVSNWEKGGRMPNIKNMRKLADLFGVSIEQLENGDPIQAEVEPFDGSNIDRSEKLPNVEIQEPLIVSLDSKTRMLREQIVNSMIGLSEEQLKNLRSFIAGMKTV